MKTILVVDDMEIFREPIAASLRLAGFKTICAPDGREALAMVAAHRPDLILLDVAMPVMDGLTFLRQLRAGTVGRDTPVILLTAMSERPAVLEAAKLGAKGYLLKSRFRVKELLERMRAQLGDNAAPESGPTTGPSTPTAASSTAASQALAFKPVDLKHPQAHAVDPPELLTFEQSRQRATDALNAKTLSGVVTQVLQLAASPRSDLSQLATLIGRDSVLAARVLQTANSSAYASTRGVITTIPEAIRVIGCSSVRNIAAALGIFDAMPPSNSDGFNFVRCWQHSFAVAQLCEQLHATADPSAGGTAYLIGLCHDLGDILLHAQFPTEMQQLHEVHARTGQPIDTLAKAMLGMTHADLMGIIFDRLALPDAIRKPVEQFHAWQRLSASRQQRSPLAHTLWLAEAYANGMLLASSEQSKLAPISRKYAREATTQFDPQRPDPNQFRADIVAMTAMLAKLSAKEERQLTDPLFAKREVRIWLTRDRTFSRFDPIQTLLESIADVTAEERPPTPEELATHDAVVVVSPDQTILSRLGASTKPLLWLSDEPPTAAAPTVTCPRHHGPAALQTIVEFVDAAAARPKSSQAA